MTRMFLSRSARFHLVQLLSGIPALPGPRPRKDDAAGMIGAVIFFVLVVIDPTPQASFLINPCLTDDVAERFAFCYEDAVYRVLTRSGTVV